MDLSTLEPGQTLFSSSMTISAEQAAAYRSAVGDGAALYDEERVVPPMAVAALVMGGAMRAIQLPPGAVHTGQELEFLRPVPEGTVLSCSASVVSNGVRRGTRLLVLELRALDGAGTAVRGRATIAVPDGGGG